MSEDSRPIPQSKSQVKRFEIMSQAKRIKMGFKRFQRKPVYIEGIQLTLENVNEVKNLFEDPYSAGTTDKDWEHYALCGYWAIRSVDDNEILLKLCNPNVFTEYYEEVEP